MTTVLTGLVVLAACLVLLWVGQRRLIYFPIDEVPAPSRLGLERTSTVSFETEDGLRLAAWLVAPDGPARGTVLVFNGNAGNRAHRVPLAAALRRRGLRVLLTDYRGYGGNPGAPTEQGLHADARAARRYLAGQPGVDPDRIVYFGESLGAAVAAGLAAETPPAALVLRSPFTSLADAGRVHFPWLPVRALLRDRFPVVARVRQNTAPLLVVAGEADTIVPFAQSRAVHAAAREPKMFVAVPGADHNDMALLAGGELLDAIEALVARALPDAGADD